MTQGNALTELETSILMTLTCADTFDQPLTLAELHTGLFTTREVTVEEVADALENSALLPALVQRRGDYWYLEGQSALVRERQHREARDRAVAAARMMPVATLVALPFVEAVYVAAFGPELTIVAKPGFAWTSWWAARWLGLPVARVMEKDRQALRERDLFTANAVLSVRPLLPGGTSVPFKASNAWAREFCANAFPSVPGPVPTATWSEKLLGGLMSPIERILEGLAGPFSSPLAAETAEMTAEFDVAWRRQLEKASAMADYNRVNLEFRPRLAE